MIIYLDGIKRDVKVPTKGLKIVSKKIDKHTHCTAHGFVYDDRKIKKEWLR